MVILCTIDLETREVSLPAGQVIASYDHNVDVIRFQAENIPGFSLDTSSIKIAAQGPNKARHDYAVDPSTVQIEEETGYITFDWPIPAGVTKMPLDVFKYGDRGQLIFAVCAEIISGSAVSKAWHSDDGIITVVAHLEPESGGGEDPEEEATNAQKIGQLQTATAILQREISGIASGTPPTADSTSEMDPDESEVYINTTDGKWYYYNGTAWTSGGVYGGAVTSTTFNQHGVPADDFAVGEALAEKADADDVGDLSQLTTTAKDNLVSAINEANEAVAGINGRLGDLADSVGSEMPSAVSLVSGGFSNSTGVDYADNTRVRFANLIHFGVGDKMVADSSLQWYWACYSDESGTTLVDIRSAGFASGEYTIATDGWYKFVYRIKNDTSADLRERIAEVEALISLVYVEPQTGLIKDIADLQGDVENLTFEQTELGNQFDHVAKKVISDKVTTLTMHRNQFTSGILNPDGSVQSSSAIFYTTIPVESGDVVTVKTFYLGSDGTAKGITDKKIGAVCAYSGGNPVPSSGKIYNANADNYIVPDGIDSIGVSFSFSGSNNRCYIYRTVPNGNTDYYEVQTTFKNPLIFSGNLSAEGFQPIGSLVCVDAYILTATCRIDGGFQSLKIGGSNAGQTGLIRPYIEVTPTQVKMYSNTSSSFDKTENHGLTLSDDLQVIVIASKDSLTAKVIVQSKGARWASGNDWRLGAAYYGFGIVSDTALSVVSASVSVRDLYKPVWICGDSWVTLYDTRWYGQAVSLGIADFLHSGHSGEGSEEGLKHLKTLLSMYTPKMIVWLYGMNDMDIDSSTPNSAWLAALNEVKTICEDRTITLVLATIPTTPTRNNNAKNAVVTASGYRFVNEVSAMGADTTGNWISGYQSDDGNHTTEAGAKALLAQVLADVPEIGLLN